MGHGISRSWATDHVVAPWCDHVASAVRSCLRASSPATGDAEVPEMVTSALLHLAAVRTGFPLSHYEVWTNAASPTGAGPALAATPREPEDCYRVAADHLGVAPAARALLHEARALWAAFPGEAPRLDVPEEAWTTTLSGEPCPICDPARA